MDINSLFCGIELRIVAAIVKYNPCSIHARGGISCSQFIGKRVCGKVYGRCEAKKYNKWYKDVLQGKMKCFYPNRIRLFEIPGTILLLYNTHIHRILGEAKIHKSSINDSKHYYWFREFVCYPDPIRLELLETDERLKSLARWKFMYVSTKTLEEIRSLSGLQGESLERTKRELEFARIQARKFLKSSVPSLTKMEGAISLLREQKRANPEVLRKTEEIFTRAIEEGLGQGRSWKLIWEASLYIAQRSFGLSVILKDIAQEAGLRIRALWKTVILLKEELDLETDRMSAKDWLLDRTRNLKLKQETIELALNLLRKKDFMRPIIGRSPASVAAFALHIAGQQTREGLTKMEIAEAFSLSVVTIRNLGNALKNVQISKESPSYWLCVTDVRNWNVTKKKRVWGVSERNRNVIQSVKKNDYLVFYLKGGIVGGIFTAKSTMYKDMKKIFFSEGDGLEKRFSLRIQVTPVLIPKKKKDFRKLINELEFIEQKENWGTSLRRAMRLISENDFRKIKSFLRH